MDFAEAVVAGEKFDVVGFAGAAASGAGERTGPTY